MKYKTNKDLKRHYKLKVDNKMPWHGETDLDKKVIKINKKKAKKSDKKGELIDTIVHEIEHVKHPKAHEKTVRRNTAKKVKLLNKKQKQKYYKLFNK